MKPNVRLRSSYTSLYLSPSDTVTWIHIMGIWIQQNQNVRGHRDDLSEDVATSNSSHSLIEAIRQCL